MKIFIIIIIVGPINKFLSIGAFQFLSKISYSMYLLHYSVIGVRMMRKKTLFHYSWYDVVSCPH